VRDILNVTGRRSPLADVALYPVRVQGPGAAEEIAHALTRLNETGGWDVIICGRGGGSLEDLWAFNEEVVARAIAASAIPVVSAVGHEVDYTIADFVADVRAETPTAAAEMVLRDRRELLEQIRSRQRLLAARIQDRLRDGRRRLERVLASRLLRRPRAVLEPLAQRLDDLGAQLRAGLKNRLRLAREHWRGLGAQLEALSPLNVLRRGYSLVYELATGRLVRDSRDLAPAAALRIRFHRGEAQVRVEKKE
jgi:exodeoxyribonuclease VII large subunit